MTVGTPLDEIAFWECDEWEENLWRRLGLGSIPKKIAPVEVEPPATSNTVVMEVLTDEEGPDGEDSDYGLSEVQLGSFTDTDGAGTEQSQRGRSWVENFRADHGWGSFLTRDKRRDRPRSQPSLRETSSFANHHSFLARSSKVRICLVSTRHFNDVTWYLFQVKEEGNETYFAKRYSEFHRLDRALRRAQWHGGGGPLSYIIIPELPGRAPLGFIGALQLDGFYERRQEGLQRYAESIVAQVESLEEVPALQAFFGSSAVGGVQSVECQMSRAVRGMHVSSRRPTRRLLI